VSDTSFNEGEKIGIVKGERAKALKIAEGMLTKHFDLATISELTGLSLCEIEQLAHQLLNQENNLL
jgi:predicted transposase/invertase (TIGR01784 family)